MAAPREGIKNLIDKHFATPELHRGQVGFDHIIKDYGDAGTTCGFVPHWMLWRMGCTDQKLIQRFEPDGISDCTSSDDDYKFRVGTGISAVSQHAAFSANKPQFNTPTKLAAALFSGQITPKCGDVGIIKGKDFSFGGTLTGSEHIFVILGTRKAADNSIVLLVVQGGQGIGARGQFGNRAEVTLKSTPGPFDIGGKNEDGPVAATPGGGTMGPRALLGILNLDSLAWGGPKADRGVKAISERSGQVSNAAVEKLIHGAAGNEVGSVWTVTANGEQNLYVFYKGHRVFWVDPKSTWRFSGSGAWFASGSGIDIVWNDWDDETWLSVTPTTAFGVTAKGKSVTAAKLVGKDYKTLLKSFKNSAGSPVG